MRILIAYYSRTNSTRRVALVIKDELIKRGHIIDVEEIKPVKERGFWRWFFLRIFQSECEIIEPKIKDVSEYDAICIGSPNWTRLSLPVAKYLKIITGLDFKNVFFFSTTALWPWFEWYIFSAYLLDVTFRQLIEKKRGRVRTDIMLSSLVKSQSIDSPVGKKKIKMLVDKMESSLPYLKDFLLGQREIERARFLVIFFSFLLIFSLIFQILAGPVIFTNLEFYLFWLINLFTFVLLVFLLEKRKKINLIKYFAAGFFVLSLTLPHFTHSLSAPSHFLGAEKVAFSGIVVLYVLALILISFWKDFKIAIFSGLMCLAGYYVLFFFDLNHFSPISDTLVILLVAGMNSFIIRSADRYYLALLEDQENLEIRTRMAQNLARKLGVTADALKEEKELIDIKIKERTRDLGESEKNLREKVGELERFHNLAVGREMKMIELKKEIEKLKQTKS